MADLTKDLAYESLSENSSKFTESNHLSTSSLSESSYTHKNCNFSRCSVCNKKLGKSALPNPIDSENQNSDPFSSKFPESQITLALNVALIRQLSSNSNSSSSSRPVLCKHCVNQRIKNDNKPDDYLNENTSHKKDTGIINMIKMTFIKLFDAKPKSPVKLKSENHTVSCKENSSHLTRQGCTANNTINGYVSINNDYNELATTPASSIIYDSISADSSRHNDISYRSCSTRNSICSLDTISVTATNDIINSLDTHDFRKENQTWYDEYSRNGFQCGKINQENPLGFKSHTLSYVSLLPTYKQQWKFKNIRSHYSLTNNDLLYSSCPQLEQMMYYLDNGDFIHQMEENFKIERISTLIQFGNRYEFNIPFNDIRFGECVKSGNKRKIYKGYWHGEVSIFVFENLNKGEKVQFWESVSNLTMVRHENIVLFMGASIEPPHFIMVTSACYGPSLYDKIHRAREKMRQSFKVSLMRQIGQAVSYLHGKSVPIIVKRLNSKNIYIEPKIVLSLLDFSQIDQIETNILDHIVIPGHLAWYAAPELLELGDQQLPKIVPEYCFVQATDVYSFGMIIYEIHMGRYPKSKNEVNEYIADICLGNRPDIKDMQAPDSVKNIIRKCWSHDPRSRPEFSDISRELMKPDTERKRHSSSLPKNLQLENYLIGYY